LVQQFGTTICSKNYVRAEKNLSKSFDLVTRTNSVDDKYFDIKLMSTHYVFRQISKLVFTAFHLFFTYQNIHIVNVMRFMTKPMSLKRRHPVSIQDGNFSFSKIILRSYNRSATNNSGIDNIGVGELVWLGIMHTNMWFRHPNPDPNTWHFGKWRKSNHCV